MRLQIYLQENTVVNNYFMYQLKPNSSVFIFLENNDLNSCIETKNLINTKHKQPTTTPKYKNLFCQTSENVGSFTRVFTVLFSIRDHQLFIIL